MIDIRPANLRDASWIMANLRQLDREETFCQLPDGLPTAKLAEWFITSGEAFAFIAYHHGAPALLFGTTRIHVCAMSVWALGTDAANRTIPAVSRFLIERAIPFRIAQGFTCMEARSLETHHDAHWAAYCALLHDPDDGGTKKSAECDDFPFTLPFLGV